MALSGSAHANELCLVIVRLFAHRHIICEVVGAGTSKHCLSGGTRVSHDSVTRSTWTIKPPDRRATRRRKSEFDVEKEQMRSENRIGERYE